MAMKTIHTTSKQTPAKGPTNGLRLRAASIRDRELSFIPSGQFSADTKFCECELDQVRQIEQGLLDAPAIRTTGGLPAHLARMCATPLLTPEEESAIFERMNYCKFRAEAIRNKLRPSRPSVAAINEYDDMIERSERLRNYLLQANTRLVMSIARKFADASNPFDDLLSQGIASLMHSVEKFDFGRGYRFSTYATCAVRRELYRMVMNRKKQSRRFSTGTSELLDGHTESEDEQQSPQARLDDYKQLSLTVGEMMKDLDDREKMILAARFGLDDSHKKSSYSHLGTRLGISKERVRQLANRALDKLRDLVPEYQLERFLD